MSIEKSNIDFDNDAKEAAAAAKEGEKEGVQDGDKGQNSEGDKERKLTETEITEVCGWLKLTLGMYLHTITILSYSYALTHSHTALIYCTYLLKNRLKISLN